MPVKPQKKKRRNGCPHPRATVAPNTSRFAGVSFCFNAASLVSLAFNQESTGTMAAGAPRVRAKIFPCVCRRRREGKRRGSAGDCASAQLPLFSSLLLWSLRGFAFVFCATTEKTKESRPYGAEGSRTQSGVYVPVCVLKEGKGAGEKEEELNLGWGGSLWRAQRERQKSEGQRRRLRTRMHTHTTKKSTTTHATTVNDEERQDTPHSCR